MSTSDITYYAVFATATPTGEETYEKLANQSFDTKATYVIGAEQSGSDDTMWYLYSYEDTDKNIGWGVMTSSPSTNTPVYFTLSGTASALVAKDGSDNYLAVASAGKFKMSTTSTSFAIKSDGTIYNTSSGSINLRHNYNNGSGGLRWYDGSTGTSAYFYKVVPVYTYSAYCTTVNVAITPAKEYTTLTSAYGLDFTGNANLKAYIAKSVADGKVTLTQVNKVPAETGLVLKASTTGSPINVLALVGDGDDMTGNKMLGSSSNTTDIAANGGYILKDGVFQPASAGTLAAGKAYLNIAVAGARPLELSFEDGEVTSVEMINAVKQNTGEFYNLAGLRVSQPTKGLYIVNGKKVVIK